MQSEQLAIIKCFQIMDFLLNSRVLERSKGSVRTPGPLPETIVIGPWMVDSFCRVKFLMRDRTRVDLPTLGGPTMAMRTGGGSTGDLSTTGTWCFFSFMSSVLGYNNKYYWKHL